jgi:hypothetical protein
MRYGMLSWHEEWRCWYSRRVCIEAKTPRPFQKAVVEILKSTIPVIVVFTKKDDIVNTHNSTDSVAIITLSEKKKQLEKLVQKHRHVAEDNTRIVYTSKGATHSFTYLCTILTCESRWSPVNSTALGRNFTACRDLSSVCDDKVDRCSSSGC